MTQKNLRYILMVLLIAAITFAVIEANRSVFAQGNGEPAVQTTPEPGEEILPPDFNWDAFNQFEARLTQCEMVDALEWLPGNIKKPVQIQRCIGPSPFLFLENPDLESLPPAENVPVPSLIEPTATEAEAIPNQ